MTQDDNRFYSYLLNISRNYLFLDKTFLQSFPTAAAILLSLFLKKESDLAWSPDSGFESGGWFYFLTEEIMEYTRFSEDRVQTAIATLKKEGLMEVERRGIPSKNYYKMNHEALRDLILSQMPEKAGTGSRKKRELEAGKNGNYPNRATIKVENKKGEGGAPDGGPPLPSKGIHELILPILAKAIALGGFKNVLPGPGKAPTGRLLSAQKFILSARSGRLARDYAFTNLERDNVQLGSLGKDGKDLSTVIYEACEAYKLMRQEGFHPADKKGLTTDLNTFFFNNMSGNSWFLYCAFNPPRLLVPNATFKAFDDLGLDRKELDLLDSLRGENWDELTFKRKIVTLHVWYYDKKRDLRMYAAFLGIVHLWSQYFGTFADLCERYLEYSKTWADWKASNFGYGNGTWPRFEAWVKGTYEGLDLCPPPKKMALATVSWQRDHSGEGAAEQKRADDKKTFDDAAEAFRKDLEKPFPGEGFDSREDTV